MNVYEQNEKLRGLLERARGYPLNWKLNADIDAALAEVVICDNDPQGELESFRRWAEIEYNINPNTEELNLNHIEVKAALKGWQARAMRGDV